MKATIQAFTACLLLAAASNAAARDAAYAIDPASIMIEEIASPQAPARPQAAAGEPGTIDVVKKIVNQAAKVIEFIEKNHPVVNIETDYANAVPENATHWTQLTGWQGPASRTYKFSAKNAAGMEVVKAVYKVHYAWGGAYKGRGKFLTGVTVEPQSVTAAWACNLDMKAEAPDESIVNAGTPEDPVAQMTLRLRWKVKTFTQNEEGTVSYLVRGDGLLQESGKAFEHGHEAKAAARAAAIPVPAFE